MEYESMSRLAPRKQTEVLEHRVDMEEMVYARMLLQALCMAIRFAFVGETH